jgi:hypothetical protein
LHYRFTEEKRGEERIEKATTVSVLLVLILALMTFPVPTIAESVQLAEEEDDYIIVFSGHNLPADAEAIIQDAHLQGQKLIYVVIRTRSDTNRLCILGE